MNMTEHCAERIADLVCDTGREPADARELLGANELRLVGEHAAREPIEGSAQRLQFAQARRRHAASEVVRANVVGGAGECVERLDDDAAQHEPRVAGDQQDVDGNGEGQREACEMWPESRERARQHHGRQKWWAEPEEQLRAQ